MGKQELTPFVMAIFCAGIFTGMIEFFSVGFNVTVETMSFVLAFVGVFMSSFFVTILDNDLKINKQIKKSLDIKHNSNSKK